MVIPSQEWSMLKSKAAFDTYAGHKQSPLTMTVVVAIRAARSA
jgi:hypothetical protein